MLLAGALLIALSMVLIALTAISAIEGDFADAFPFACFTLLALLWAFIAFDDHAMHVQVSENLENTYDIDVTVINEDASPDSIEYYEGSKYCIANIEYRSETFAVIKEDTVECMGFKE